MKFRLLGHYWRQGGNRRFCGYEDDALAWIYAGSGPTGVGVDVLVLGIMYVIGFVTE